MAGCPLVWLSIVRWGPFHIPEWCSSKPTTSNSICLLCDTHSKFPFPSPNYTPCVPPSVQPSTSLTWLSVKCCSGAAITFAVHSGFNCCVMSSCCSPCTPFHCTLCWARATVSTGTPETPCIRNFRCFGMCCSRGPTWARRELYVKWECVKTRHSTVYGHRIRVCGRGITNAMLPSWASPFPDATIPVLLWKTSLQRPTIVHSCIPLVFFCVGVVLVACCVVYVPWWLHVMMLIRSVWVNKKSLPY